VTLLAVVVLALILLAVNLTTKSGDDAASRAAQNAPAAAAPAAPPPAAAAPAASAFPAKVTYTGHTSGRQAGEASVAVAVKDGKASAYVCDGKKLESWMEGRVEGSSVKLTGKDGAELTGTLNQDKLTGDVKVQGASWAYTATPGKGPAGLYRARNANADAGWIVRDDGSQTGVQTVNGQSTPAPALDPAAGNAVLGGTAVPVVAIQGGDAATVGR
jgi:serine/threonine-protein kinase